MEQRNRDFATEDHRRNSNIDYSLYKAISGIFDAPPPTNRNRCGQFIEEISIPQQLASYEIDFASIAGVLRPDQHTVNAISGNIGIAQSNALAYRYYIYLDLARKPRVPPIIVR